MGRIGFCNRIFSKSTGAIIVLLAFSFFCKVSLGQNSSFDSIPIWEKNIGTTSDVKRKLELLNKITTSLCYQKPKVCLQYCKAQEELAIKTNNREKLVDAYLNASVASREIAQFENALNYNLKAIRAAEQNKDTLNIAHSYNYLAIYYHIRKDYTLAEKYYLKSLSIFNTLKGFNALFTIQSNLSDVYINTNRRDEAELFLKKSIAGRKVTGNKRSIGIGYYSFGSFLINEKKHSDAVTALDSAIAYLKNGEDDFFFYQTIVLKGAALLGAKKYQPSNKIVLEAISNEMVKNNPDLLFQAYGIISNNFEALNQPAEALKYSKLELALADTIFKNDKLQALSEAQAKFDTDKQQKEIELLNREKKINETEIEKQKVIRNIFIVGSIVVLIFMLIIIRSLRINRRAKKVIFEQKEILEIRNKEVTDSILYAKRIQATLLAQGDFLMAHVPEHFILFKPKDIVSGDFYWATEANDWFYLAVCDSTGHGVPGAFMSLLNITFLNEAINEKNISLPGQVFNHIRKRLIENISHDGAQDGMDGILVAINKKKSMVYSAAHNRPILIRSGKLIELNCDKMAVGKGIRNEEFETFNFQLQTNDLLYLYTDGYADQFGGPRSKKFMNKQLSETLLTLSALACDKQRESLESILNTWKGNQEQVDDVCIIGIKI